MVARVVLFGTGSVARVAYVALVHDSPYEVAAFTEDRECVADEALFGLPVVPFAEVATLYPPAKHKMFVAIGYERLNRTRAERCVQAKEMGYQLITYISSKAAVWPDLVIGENCMVGPNAVIQPFVEIGNDVFIRGGSFVGHNAILKDHCFLAGGVVVLGHAVVEPYCLLGANSTVRNNVTIGSECVIGAGAVILQDTQERQVYVSTSADLLPVPSDQLNLR